MCVAGCVFACDCGTVQLMGYDQSIDGMIW